MNRCWSLEKSYCLYLQEQAVRKLFSLTAWFLDISGTAYSRARLHNPQKINFTYHRRENLKSRDAEGILLIWIDIRNLQNKRSVILRFLGYVGNCRKGLFVGCWTMLLQIRLCSINKDVEQRLTPQSWKFLRNEAENTLKDNSKSKRIIKN